MNSEGKFWIAFWSLGMTFLIIVVLGGYISSTANSRLSHERQLDAQKRIELAIKQGIDPIEARCAYYWENKAVCITAATTRKQP